MTLSRKFQLRLAMLITLVLTLAACGQTGELRLPSEEDKAAKATSSEEH